MNYNKLTDADLDVRIADAAKALKMATQTVAACRKNGADLAREKSRRDDLRDAAVNAARAGWYSVVCGFADLIGWASADVPDAPSDAADFCSALRARLVPESTPEYDGEPVAASAESNAWGQLSYGAA